MIREWCAAPFGLVIIEAIRATENEESVCIDEVRKELIKMGIPENELAKIPNV